ncbi:expressed protein [Echinococcus multilocularis]|uniref:Expressed protein n=1 Tax=Echinococcus multilocularis TaxID=6211 RepID=A0A068Y7P1_ECHMU|nr:expressed protein [Echinococcus multilocularis]
MGTSADEASGNVGRIGSSTHSAKPELSALQTGNKEAKKARLEEVANVAARASKGRKIRYLKIPKAVDFMCPEIVNHFSEVQRGNILGQMKATCR